jgi:AAA15 family ATPase/GTPase
MLLQFTTSNFRAFREPQTLSLAASNYDKKLPANCISPELPGLKGQRWLKGVALYGPNAGGKSTLIEAIEALAKMVRSSAKATDPKDRIRQIEPFALAPGKPVEPTGFGAVFVSDGVRYEYRVAATPERVWHESLRAFPSGKEQLWFCREWQPEQQSYKWSPDKPTGYRRDAKKEEFTLPNVLFLSKAISLGDTQLEPVFRWFKERLRFVDLSVRAGGLPLGLSTASEVFRETALAPRIKELMKHADIGITAVAVREETLDEKTAALLERMKELFPDGAPDNVQNAKRPRIELSHASPEGKSIALPWEAESAGTHRLFELAGPWLDILENGYTVCIDEIETSMHPLMVMALLRLLFDEKTNPKGAQVIFTTHNPLLLDTTLLRRDQVWFADKDDHGEAHLYPLTDYAPRNVESLVRGYLAGRYGAVPFIPQGLLGAFPPENPTGEKESDEQ